VDPVDPANPTVPPATTPPADALPTGGQYKSSVGMGAAVSAGFGIGASVASAAAGLPSSPPAPFPANNALTANVTTNSTPLILPGLFTAASTQSVMPVDRISFDYGYFNGFAIVGPAGVTPRNELRPFFYPCLQASTLVAAAI
jgi:hypothetical protein